MDNFANFFYLRGDLCCRTYFHQCLAASTRCQNLGSPIHSPLDEGQLELRGRLWDIWSIVWHGFSLEGEFMGTGCTLPLSQFTKIPKRLERESVLPYLVRNSGGQPSSGISLPFGFSNHTPLWDRAFGLKN